MSTRYGPWATLIDAGRNPQLSSFWRRRLTMLVPTSRTSAVLSHGSIAILFAAALMIIALPTLRIASAVAEERKATQGNVATLTMSGAMPAEKGDDSREEKPADKSAKPKGYGYIGVMTYSSTSPTDMFYLPLLAYYPLNNEAVRRELRITDEQQKKLREISRDFMDWQQEFVAKIRNEAETLSPEERAAKRRDFDSKWAQQQADVRRKVEKLLTPEQLNDLRAIAIGSGGKKRGSCSSPN